MTQMRCGKKSMSSFKFLSKEKQKRAKKTKERRKKHCANELNYTNSWIVYSPHVGMPNIIHEFFFMPLFSYFAG